MKPHQWLLGVLILFGLYPATIHAQFIKKLGKSVKQVGNAVLKDDKKSSGNNDDTPAGEATGGNTNQTKAAAVIDFTKYNIVSKTAGHAAFNAGEYFIENYSYILPDGDGLKSVVAVGVMDEKERLSELGEGSGKDVAVIYENGVKTATATISQLDKKNNVRSKKYDWYYINESRGGNNDPYIKVGGANGMAYTIVFNGKKYGPYLLVFGMIVDNTKSRFYATVSVTRKDIEQQKTYLLSNDGKLKPVEFGGSLLANIDFSNGCTIIAPAARYAAMMAKEDNETKQEAIQQKMTDAMMNHQNENDIIFLDGRKMVNIYSSSPWLSQSGDNIFSVKEDGDEKLPAGLYLNGKNIANARPQPGEAWCNTEGTDWAYIKYESGGAHLIFKDGADIRSALHPRQIVAGNKNYIAWFMYSRAVSDEITICFKEL